MEKSENEKLKEATSSYDEKGNATHYDMDRINTIVKMERIWGTLSLMNHCEITAFKYRDRLGKKEDQPIELDLRKAKWYERAAKYYYKKLKTETDVIYANPSDKLGLPWEN